MELVYWMGMMGKLGGTPEGLRSTEDSKHPFLLFEGSAAKYLTRLNAPC